MKKNYPEQLKSAVGEVMRPRVLVSLIDNPALLADVLESVADRAPLAVRSLRFHASGGRFPGSSTVLNISLRLVKLCVVLDHSLTSTTDWVRPSRSREKTSSRPSIRALPTASVTQNRSSFFPAARCHRSGSKVQGSMVQRQRPTRPGLAVAAEPSFIL